MVVLSVWEQPRIELVPLECYEFIMWFSGSFTKVPRLFCGPYSEMMVNCFACGKDIGVSTERRSFSGERPSESKVRVLHAWRSMVQEELSLSGHRIESIDHLFQPYTNKLECADHALRATKELMNLMQCFETILEPF